MVAEDHLVDPWKDQIQDAVVVEVDSVAAVAAVDLALEQEEGPFVLQEVVQKAKDPSTVVLAFVAWFVSGPVASYGGWK